MSAQWRWTDEDSRDLDERTRAMRKPSKYVPPSTSKEVNTKATRPVTTFDQFVSRPGKRPSAEEQSKREWERTKAQLKAAGVRVVETPPLAQPQQPRMPRQRKPPAPPRTRTCIDCGADISRRGPTAVRCTEDAYAHSRRLAIERAARRSKENQQ